MMNKARQFMLRNARPLDLARWMFHFENGSREAVLCALSAYQNADGGFGHALEADCFNPDSSPIQTWTATEILREIGMSDAAHPLVKGIVRYLSSGAAFDGHMYHRTVPTNDLHPRAPWWTHGPHPENEYNPTASLAGFLVRFAQEGSEAHGLGERLVREAYAYFAVHAPLSDMHTAACFVQMYEDLLAANRRDLVDMDAFETLLGTQIDALIEKDSEKWATQYVCKPSQLIRMGSPFYSRFEALCAGECDMLRREQEEDGSWRVTWNWMEYLQEWGVARCWWKGDIIVKNMRFIRCICKKTEIMS
ncbi:MAG: hypothetical protein IKU34_12040 [Clostridia bacterium]|nr:hypothetical protein [Clostridia bacterium]